MTPLLKLQQAIILYFVVHEFRLCKALAPYLHGKSSTRVVALNAVTRYEDIGNQEAVNTNALICGPPNSFTAAKEAEVVSQISDQAERKFPFNLIVGHDDLKEAAMIAAANPNVSGILIGGRHGTGKSVMARAIHQLLPKTIDRVKGSLYNIDPSGKGGLDSLLLQEMTKNGVNLSDLEVESVSTPFINVPLNVMEDSLCGTVDIERSIVTGSPVFASGLLAKAHRGVLYIDDIHLLDDDILSILFDVLSDGYVKVEREGISIRYPCAPIVIATWNPEEGDITRHFTDRIAMSVSTDSKPLTIEQRVEAVNNVINFSGAVEGRDQKEYNAKEKRSIAGDESMRNTIVNARQRMDDVNILTDQVLYLCEEATRADCDGQRGEIFATHIAKTCAAIDGRNEVAAQDLQTAVRLALGPRSKFFNDFASTNNCDAQERQNDVVPIAPPSREQGGIDTQEQPTETNDEPGENDEQQNQEMEQEMVEDESDNADSLMTMPEEFMFDVSMVPIDPELLTFMERTKKGSGGKRSKKYNLERGRFCKAIFPKPGGRGRIAVGATLRAAAPYQKIRRALARGTKREGKVVYVDKSDFRIKRMTRKAGALVIFVVDSSGSMALNRMDAAKGAAISLLLDAYRSRDKICLISFHQQRADVLVPPTKSLALTKKRLESMPCGGGSPLAHALLQASKVALNEKTLKKDVGKVIIVLLTDGRCNVPLCISRGEGFDPLLLPSIDGRPTKEFLQGEVLSCAKCYRKLHLDLLVIDTEDKFVATGIGRKIADAALGRYYQIDPRDTDAITTAVTKEFK